MIGQATLKFRTCFATVVLTVIWSQRERRIMQKFWLELSDKRICFNKRRPIWWVVINRRGRDLVVYIRKSGGKGKGVRVATGKYRQSWHWKWSKIGQWDDSRGFYIWYLEKMGQCFKYISTDKSGTVSHLLI